MKRKKKASRAPVVKQKGKKISGKRKGKMYGGNLNWGEGSGGIIPKGMGKLKKKKVEEKSSGEPQEGLPWKGFAESVTAKERGILGPSPRSRKTSKGGNG